MGFLSFIGDIFGAKSAEKQADKANALSADQFNRSIQWAKKQFGMTQDWEREQFDRGQYQNARFAKNAAGWQMQDLIDTARENGIHALSALGGGAAQYSPVNVGSSANAAGPSPTGGVTNNAGALLGDAIGEGLDAVYGKFSKEAKKSEQRSDEMYRLKKQREEAEIELLKSQSRTTLAGIRATASDGRKDITNTDQDAVQNIRKIETEPLNPMSYYHEDGPYKHQFVIPMSNGTYVLPKNTVPSEVAEAISGGTVAEVTGLLNDLGAKRIGRPKLPSKPRGKGDYLGQMKQTSSGWYQWTKNGWKGPRKHRNKEKI